MNATPPPALGAAVNLLYGAAGLALARPPRAPLQLFAADFSAGPPGPWSPPRVTLHDGPASLAACLCRHRVVPLRFDGPGFSIEPMLLRDPQDGPALVRQLESLLGVPLEGLAGADACCLLFERRRIDGRAEHEAARPPARREFDRARHLAPEWRMAGSRLRPGRHIHDGSEQDAVVGARAAQAYVDAFYDYGTHFVSALDVGDALFQAIVLRPQQVAAVRQYWDAAGGGPVEGAAALPFHVFAAPAYALHAGPVVSLAGDPVPPGFAAGGAGASLRLLAGPVPLASDAARTATAIGVELSSLGRFMEFHRGRNFERVLRGALLQRWGTRVNTTLRRLPGVVQALAATVLPGAADRIAQFPGPGEVRCARVLDLRRAPGRIAAEGIALAQFVDAAPCTAQAPTLRLPDAGFDQPGLACAVTAGALVLENAAGTRRDAVVDGLRFTSGTDACGLARVRLHGGSDAAPKVAPAVFIAGLQSAACTLAFAAGGDAWRRHAAAAYAGWLGEVLAAGGHAAPALRAWAACLARLEPCLPPLPRWDERARPGLAAIGAAAVKAGEVLRGLAPGDETAAALDALDAIDRALSRRYLALLEDSGAQVSNAPELPAHADARQRMAVEALDAALEMLAAQPLHFEGAAAAFAAIDLGAGPSGPITPWAERRLVHARLRLDAWQHAHLIPALRQHARSCGPDAAPPVQRLDLARLSILTTLGQAAQGLAHTPWPHGGVTDPDVAGLAFIHLQPIPERPIHD